MKKILITGKNGYIAKSLISALGYNYNIIAIGREDFDLTDEEKTIEFFKNKWFDVIIHTAIIGGSRLKPDTNNVLYNNVSMFDNLLKCKNNFKKFITFGSGAELKHDTIYGESKYRISQKIEKIPNFYNLRIFGIFDENELDSRFIKNNIVKYIKQQPFELHFDKQMDFIYMNDFIKIVKLYLENEDLPKTIDCCYKEKKSLLDILEIINNCSVIYKQEFNYDNNFSKTSSYIGEYNPILDNLNFIGLEQGILNTYNELLIRLSELKFFN